MKTKVKLMRARWGRVTRINGSSVGVDDAVLAIFQLYDNCESYINQRCADIDKTNPESLPNVILIWIDNDYFLCKTCVN